MSLRVSLWFEKRTKKEVEDADGRGSSLRVVGVGRSLFKKTFHELKRRDVEDNYLQCRRTMSFSLDLFRPC